jgi:hypothetical protein
MGSSCASGAHLYSCCRVVSTKYVSSLEISSFLISSSFVALFRLDRVSSTRKKAPRRRNHGFETPYIVHQYLILLLATRKIIA